MSTRPSTAAAGRVLELQLRIDIWGLKFSAGLVSFARKEVVRQFFDPICPLRVGPMKSASSAI
jgi:hypothetical protein